MATDEKSRVTVAITGSVQFFFLFRFTVKDIIPIMKNIKLIENTVSIKTRLNDESVAQLEALADEIIANC